MFKKKKILCLVPARGGSKGIKNKNLRKIKKKTLLQITSDFIDKIKIIDLKILSTDSKKIKKIGKKLKFKIINRPKYLSGDRISDYKVIEHALKELKNQNLFFDYLIYLQVTSPIRKKIDLIKNLKKVINKRLDSCWSVTKIDKTFHPLKILKKEKNYVKLYNNLGKNIIARQQLKDLYIRNGIFYIFDCRSILKNKSIYLKKCLPAISNHSYVNIDTKKDLKKAQEIYL
jgi:CMP-N,N'-diacetyllegionaminic acid synthase